MLKEEDKTANEPEYAVPEGIEGKPQPLKSPQSLDENDVFSSEDAGELEEEAAKYHHEEWEFLTQKKKKNTRLLTVT